MVPEPKDHAKIDDKMSPFASLYARLSMKLFPKAVQRNGKFITSKIWYNHLNPLLLVDFVNISHTAS